MKFTRGSIALYMGLVFVCGGVLGFYGNRVYTLSSATSPTAQNNKKGPNPEEFRKRLVAEYKRRLSLTDDQILQLNLILDDTRAKAMGRINTDHEHTRTELDKIRQAQIDRINSMLTSDQRTEYDKLLKERAEQRQKDKENKEKSGGHNGPGF